MSGLTPEQLDQLAAISDWVDCNDGDDIAQRIWLAEAANARLRATVERVEALLATRACNTPARSQFPSVAFADGCRTTWRTVQRGTGPFVYGTIECVEVPLDDLRAALAPEGMADPPSEYEEFSRVLGDPL